MTEYRIGNHPILPIVHREAVEFFWKGEKLAALQGDTIAAALFAQGIHVFGTHHKDGSPQGIYCANGQCAQCMVLAEGKPVKACIELISAGLRVEPVNGLPELPIVTASPTTQPIQELSIPVLIIGGGPAGLSAAIELGKNGVNTLLVDDKHRLGGKLVLQTHRFFGSREAVFAGTRGIDIATRLEDELRKYPSVTIWTHSSALAVFSDQRVGILRDGKEYALVTPEMLLVASGAREKFLAFKGNTLPGVTGAGAFQTLVNRDLVRPARRLFIVGGGNVGLIAGYHALQAGIEVAGLVEALPECGGYKVHKDKLVRMGVPIYTSHTILSANGADSVESVTIAQVDEHFRPIPGTERSFACDSVLIAVGLDPVDEFYVKAKQFGLAVCAAGDAEEIAEASAAIFSGKIKGREILQFLGRQVEDVPEEWVQTAVILRSKPGPTGQELFGSDYVGALPVIHCTQEIPCNPCSSVCTHGLIDIDSSDIRQVPKYLGDARSCKMCERCLTICPGLAITLVDYRKDTDFPTVSIPFEFSEETVAVNDVIAVQDTTGAILDRLVVIDVAQRKNTDRTRIVKVKAPRDIARKIAGIQVQDPQASLALDQYVEHIADDAIVCRCERVTAGEIRALIREGYRDMNEIKIVSRAGMGSCGSKTCGELIMRLFREEGISPRDTVEFTKRPLFIEVPLSVFAGEVDIQGDTHA